MNILNLPSLKITHTDDGDDLAYVIAAESIYPPSACGSCGSDGIIKFGTRPQFFFDTPMHGKPVFYSSISWPLTILPCLSFYSLH